MGSLEPGPGRADRKLKSDINPTRWSKVFFGTRPGGDGSGGKEVGETEMVWGGLRGTHLEHSGHQRRKFLT